MKNPPRNFFFKILGGGGFIIIIDTTGLKFLIITSQLIKWSLTTQAEWPIYLQAKGQE